MTSAGLDLKNPGGKETIVVAGAALGLGLIYFAVSGKGKSGAAAAPAGSAAPAGPDNQTFLPGQQSQTGNAFLDTLFTTPATSSPGTPIVTTPGPRQPPPPRVLLPVQHVEQGAGSVLGQGSVLVPSISTAGTGTSLGGSWQGTSLFTSPVSPVAWANSVLTALTAPKTSANQQSLIAWALNEGGGGAYNPLNTTQGPGSNFNSVGVKNFPNWSTGAQSTAATIRNGRYPNILAGLLSGKGIGSSAAPDLQTWSGQGYSSIASNWTRAGGIVSVYVKQQQAVLKAAAARRATQAASAARVRSLFPVVRPGGRAVPIRSTRLGYSILNAVSYNVRVARGRRPSPWAAHGRYR